MGTTVTGKMGQDTYKRNREAGEPLGVWKQSPPFLKTKKCPAGPAHILFPFCRVPQFPLGLSLRLPLGLGSEVGIDSSKAQPRVLRSDSGMVQGLLHPSHHKVHDFSRRQATVWCACWWKAMQMPSATTWSLRGSFKTKPAKRGCGVWKKGSALETRHTFLVKHACPPPLVPWKSPKVHSGCAGSDLGPFLSQSQRHQRSSASLIGCPEFVCPHLLKE